jgi:putative metallohydrolase (TIGR04338 family)
VGSTAVYAAEDQWSAVLDRGGAVDFFGSRIDVPMQRRFGDLASVQAYVAAVLGLPAVVDAYPTAPPVSVRERAGQTKAHYEPGTATIAVPLRTLWAARESVVLHEVAHHLMLSAHSGPERPEWHGPEFRGSMCALVAIVLGDPAALLLRAGYESAGLPTAVLP